MRLVAALHAHQAGAPELQDVRLLHADAVYLGAGLQRGARGSPDLVLLRAPARPRTRAGLRRLPSPRLPGFSSSCPSKGEHTELHAALKTRRTSARAFIRGPMGSVLGEQGGGPALMDTRPTPDPRPRVGHDDTRPQTGLSGHTGWAQPRC